MFPVLTSPRGSRKAILSLYWVTSSPRVLNTSPRDSLFGAANAPDSVGTGTASTALAAAAAAAAAAALERTRSAQDLGAARTGETGLTEASAVVTEGVCSASGVADLGVSDPTLEVSLVVWRRGVPGTFGTTGTTGAGFVLFCVVWDFAAEDGVVGCVEFASDWGIEVVGV